MMTRTKVKSDALASMGYDQRSETLEVEFHPKDKSCASDGCTLSRECHALALCDHEFKPLAGDVWRYSPVPKEVYAAMQLPGTSIGSTFAREVRKNPLVTGTRVHLDEAP